MAFAKFKRPVIEDTADADYRAYFDSEVFRVWHLKGKERTFRIARVQRITSEYRGLVEKKPLLHLVDSKGREQLPFAANKTNCKTIAALYGNNPHQWVGKTITMFPTTTDAGGETHDCIRVRPYIPGTNVERRGNRNGATVLRQLPANTVTDAEFDDGAESVREPGDDSHEVENVIR